MRDRKKVKKVTLTREFLEEVTSSVSNLPGGGEIVWIHENFDTGDLDLHYWHDSFQPCPEGQVIERFELLATWSHLRPSIQLSPEEETAAMIGAMRPSAQDTLAALRRLGYRIVK